MIDAKKKAEELAQELEKQIVGGIYSFVSEQGLSTIQQALTSAYEEGRQSVLSRWPSEDEIEAWGDERGLYIGKVGNTAEFVEWLRERLGVK